jgi:hypothetical protein
MPATISTRQAAEMLGCSIAYIHQQSNKVDCPWCVRVGTKKRILTDQFREWMDSEARQQ